MGRNRRRRDGKEDVQVFRALVDGTPTLEYLRRAVASQLAGRFADAARDYRSALLIDPNNPFALNNYGFLLLRLGVIVDAHQLFSRAVELAPEYALAHNN